MGAGKTSVGRLLAAKLGRRHVDTDALIETQTGNSVATLFKEYGEAAFRALETRVLRALARDGHCVVSLGGGVPTLAANRVLLKNGLWVHLDVPFPELWRRIAQNPKRPLVRGGESAVRELFRQRAPFYARAAIVIRCGLAAPEAVCDKIIKAI